MVNINGTVSADDAAYLSINNRGYLYGDALFETIRVINGKIMFWEDHYFRLMASMRIMRMEIPMQFSPEFIEKEILALIEANALQTKPAKVKITIHRKMGGLYLPENRETEYIIQTFEHTVPFYRLEKKAYEVELFKDHYVNSGLLSTLKTNNKAVHVLGSIYAEENGFQNCFLLNEKKSVVEALNGNIFVVKDNVIKTPPLSEGCLNGVTRKQLIEILKKIPDYELKEEAVSPFELQKADEIFITNVMVGILPVSKYRKKGYDATVAMQLLAKLNAMARLN